MPQPPIDRALLARLEAMARLRLPADRLALVRDRLERVLAAFAGLRELPGAAHGTPAADLAGPGAGPPLVLRADEPGSVLSHEQALANAPRAAAGSFVVPRVVDS